METRILTAGADKGITRPLYEAVFSDPPVFVDFYYREICPENTVFCRVEDGRAVSMLHLNPYRLRFCGAEIQGWYMVAVATDPAYRHRGLMAGLIREAADWLRARHVPFVYLMPVDERIYAGQDFHTVCPFAGWEAPDGPLESQFDLYCVPDERYCRLRAAEQALGEEEDGLPPHPVFMFRITDETRFGALSGLDRKLGRTPSPDECITFLRRLRIRLAEDV